MSTIRLKYVIVKPRLSEKPGTRRLDGFTKARGANDGDKAAVLMVALLALPQHGLPRRER
jgi:hypothetical protein